MMGGERGIAGLSGFLSAARAAGTGLSEGLGNSATGGSDCTAGWTAIARSGGIERSALGDCWSTEGMRVRGVGDAGAGRSTDRVDAATNEAFVGFTAARPVSAARGAAGFAATVPKPSFADDGTVAAAATLAGPTSLAAGFFVTGVLATVVLATGLLTTGLIATGLLATGLLATGLLATGLPEVDFRTTELFTTGLVAAGSFTANLSSEGSGSTGFATTSVGDGFNTELGAGRLASTRAGTAGDSPAEDSMAIAGRGEAATWIVGATDAGTAEAGTGGVGIPTAGAAATSDLAGAASLDSTAGTAGFATVDSERRVSVGRSGAAATRGEAGLATGGRETTCSGVDGDTAFAGESSRNFLATDRSGRTASDRFSTVRGDATTGMEATGVGPIGWAGDCFAIVDVATCGGNDGAAATCGTATWGTAPREVLAIGPGWFDTTWSLVERFTTTEGESSRSFRVTAAPTGGDSDRVGSTRGGTIATVGVAGTGRLGRATIRSATLGKTGVSVAASRNWRFTLDSSRICRLAVGSTRGGVAAINGVAGFSAGPTDGVTIESLAFDAGAFVPAFPDSTTECVGISRSRSCRVAGIESFMVRATAVGRVVEPIRGVGTGTNSSRVSLMLRVAAVTPGLAPPPFVDELPTGFAPGTDETETGLAGTARTATGRGVLPRIVDELADAFPSLSERETLTCRVSPIRRGKSFATTPRACPNSCAATTTANETQLRMAHHPWFRDRTPKQSFGPRKVLST